MNKHVETITTNVIDLATAAIKHHNNDEKLVLSDHPLTPLQHAAYVGVLAQTISQQLEMYDEEVCDSFLEAIADGLKRGVPPTKLIPSIVMQIVEQHASIFAVYAAGEKYWPYDKDTITREGGTH